MHKLTVAILTYNRPDYLVKMLDSINAQSYKDFYAVIFDNGSTDNTCEIIKPYLNDNRFSYHKEQKNISGEIFNVILDNCNTEYLIITHDDDIMLPAMLEKQITVLESNENISLVSTNVNIIDSNDNITGYNKQSSMTNNKDLTIKPKEYINYYIKDKNIIICPTVMLRMSAIKDNNLSFRPDEIGISHDTFFWFELNQLPYDFYYLNEALYSYRVHNLQDSRNGLKMMPYLKIPVYNLLVNSQYPKKTVSSWIKYSNIRIISVLQSQKNIQEAYKEIKPLIFIPNINETSMHIMLFFTLYFTFILKIFKYPYRLYRKIKKVA